MPLPSQPAYPTPASHIAFRLGSGSFINATRDGHLFPEADPPLCRQHGSRQECGVGRASSVREGTSIGCSAPLLSTLPACLTAHWMWLFTSNLVRCSQERPWLKQVKNINILSLCSAFQSLGSQGIFQWLQVKLFPLPFSPLTPSPPLPTPHHVPFVIGQERECTDGH